MEERSAKLAHHGSPTSSAILAEGLYKALSMFAGNLTSPELPEDCLL